jgi:hypothetical protein
VRHATLRIVTYHASRLREQMVSEYGPDLSGFCGEATFKLQRILEEAGHRPSTISGRVQLPDGSSSHWWLKLHHWYIDITGDQFNRDLPKKDRLPKILVWPISRCKLYLEISDDDTALLACYGEKTHQN